MNNIRSMPDTTAASAENGPFVDGETFRDRCFRLASAIVGLTSASRNLALIHVEFDRLNAAFYQPRFRQASRLGRSAASVVSSPWPG